MNVAQKITFEIIYLQRKNTQKERCENVKVIRQSVVAVLGSLTMKITQMPSRHFSLMLQDKISDMKATHEHHFEHERKNNRKIL
jgi:hypothetical protein